MKKLSLFKVLAIMFAAFVLMSWLIPASSYSNGSFVSAGLDPIGIFDLFRIPFIVLTNYAPYILFFLTVGGLYGVINKTGVYDEAVMFFVKGFKKSETVILISTVLIFGLLSSFTGLNLVLFILVPFFMTILLKMNYSKLTAIMATVGSIIVGNFASLYGFNVSGFINYFFKLDVNDNIVIKLILFVASFALLILFLLQDVKKLKKEKNEELPLFEKNKENKKSFIPLVIILDIAILFLLVAGFNWKYGLGVEIFETVYTDMMAYKIGEFAIFNFIIGSVNPIGWWNITDFIVFMVMLALLISWVYSIKIKDAFEAFVEGAKEMVVPALYASFAFILMAAFSLTSQGGIYNTIVDSILSIKDGFSYIGVILLPLVSALFQNDLTSIVDVTSGAITTVVTDVKAYPIYGIAYQSLHSLMMLILPTSFMLVAALTYLKVSYIDWIKYVWKFLLGLFVLSVIVITLMTILI
jgi:uncharacterized ion transporter superfamily protein YfcC